MKKKNLLLCASNLTQFDSFQESLFLEKVKKKYNIKFLVNVLDKKYLERIDKLSRFGEIFEGYNGENSSLFYKKFLFFRQKINLYCYFANEIIKNKDRFKDNFVVFRTLGVNAPHLIKLFNILKYLRLLKILYYFGDIFLKIFKVNHLEKNKIFDKIDMVLISFKIYDPSGFCDEVIRHCKRNKIISYGVQINWDALVFRIPYQIPDYLGVWGEQSFVFALGVHKISPYRIFPIGPLLFDKYKNLNISKIQAQKILGLPENKKIIAVCLSDNAFDNIFLIKKINECLKTKLLDDDYYFYFKGYRGGKKVTLTDAFKAEYNTNYEKIDFHDNIKFWDPNENKLAKKEYYQFFYKAIDGVVSNFSTMALESLINSVPTLILDYNPANYGVNATGYPFRLYSYHLYSLRNQEGIAFCNSREDFVEKIRNFSNTDFIDKQKIIQKVFSSVYWDDNLASDKLVRSLDIIFNKNKRDVSDIGYL